MADRWGLAYICMGLYLALGVAALLAAEAVTVVRGDVRHTISGEIWALGIPPIFFFLILGPLFGILLWATLHFATRGAV